MTNRQKAIGFLQKHSEGVDDDELDKALNFTTRQQANIICRKLASEKLIERRLVRGKIHNFWVGGNYVEQKNVTAVASSEKSENWFWEGNVQNQIVRFLSAQNFKIVSVADTASHEQGKDIVAEINGVTLWVTVKGFPTGTEKTQPSTQAGHWFKDAVFDILQYRGASKENRLGLALPDFPRYRSLAKRIAWLKPIANFVYFWVKKDGQIVVE
jgi:hypothetical protein